MTKASSALRKRLRPIPNPTPTELRLLRIVWDLGRAMVRGFFVMTSIIFAGGTVPGRLARPPARRFAMWLLQRLSLPRFALSAREAWRADGLTETVSVAAGDGGGFFVAGVGVATG